MHFQVNPVLEDAVDRGHPLACDKLLCQYCTARWQEGLSDTQLIMCCTYPYKDFSSVAKLSYTMFDFNLLQPLFPLL